MTAQRQTTLNVNVCSVYVYIMVMHNLHANVYIIHDYGLCTTVYHVVVMGTS